MGLPAEASAEPSAASLSNRPHWSRLRWRAPTAAMPAPRSARWPCSTLRSRRTSPSRIASAPLASPANTTPSTVTPGGPLYRTVRAVDFADQWVRPSTAARSVRLRPSTSTDSCSAPSCSRMVAP